MEINYQLSAEDLEAARLHVLERARARKPTRAWRLWRASAIAIAVVYLLNNLELANASPYPAWVWAVAGLAFMGSAIWVSVWMRSGRYQSWLGQFAGSYAFAMSAAGIAVRGPGGRVTFYRWPEIIALETTESRLYFYLRRNVALAVPCAAFGSDALQTFLAEARRLWAEDPGHARRSLPELPGTADSWASQGWANLRVAARLVFFRKFDIQAFYASHGALSWLLLVHLLWLGAMDYVEALPAPEFRSLGFSTFGASVLLTLAWAAAVSASQARRASLIRLLVMIAASTLVIDAIYLPLYLATERLLPDTDELLWILYAAVTLWLLAAVFRIMRVLFRQPVPHALYLTSIYAVFILVVAVLVPQQHFYYKAEPDDSAASSEEEPNLDVEDVYYRQPELVRRALERLTPRHTHETSLYFVGFAGDASEREFGNEVRYAWDLLNHRFNAAGHSLVLINDPDMVRQVPLANTHNLDAVLQGLASRMDRERDVLFLFLSSHGAQDHRLAVSFSPLEMNDLRVEELKEMLDKSGIRNRVIVVSACYSGGFLDVLKDDNTVVLTASSRDHVAYGCGDVTEYTYFGEAYFVKALGHSDSFIAAFDEARRLIAEREKSEGKDASRPQIHVGRNIGKVLHRLKVAPVRAPGCPDDCPGESG